MGECSRRDKVMADGAINLEMLDFVMAGLICMQIAYVVILKPEIIGSPCL